VALTLLRHTRPLAAEGLCYGASELELGPDFAIEAQALLARLARPDRIVTSPLLRCLRLAELLGAQLAVPVEVEPDWREMDFGSWEGRAWSDIPRAELDAWAADFLHARPHGGESVAMLLARTRRALDGCRTPEVRSLAVTHAGVIRAALAATGGGATAWNRAIGFGEAVALDLQPLYRATGPG
jgi:alpha-ribazole phosphatase